MLLDGRRVNSCLALAVAHDRAEMVTAAGLAPDGELQDPYVNPMGTKGVGGIGIAGVAAAIANAVHHATGVRIRDLPISLDKLLPDERTAGQGES
ncbi:(2Fe-2S)-binding protein [Micromonospora narathiwatensis]|uniref:hypothetical protein n=1 Tax=Micromonospora narathiwatensis TaxID=299146 RepID=UPI000A3E8F7F